VVVDPVVVADPVVVVDPVKSKVLLGSIAIAVISALFIAAKYILF
jgi:hypothetical protein